MKFNTIELNNIGPYAGKNKFDFTGEQSRKVVLIGGKNGAGKTTLLNSIKIGLFGSFSFGYKSDNKEYFNRINQLLNNKAKESNIQQPFSISIQFSINEDYESKDYKLTRYWKINDNKLYEFFQVESSGKILKENDTHIFQTKLREFLPPQLLDFCLFDGEEISNIVNNNELSAYLNALSKVVFKLNLFEQLEEDLKTYSQQALATSDKNHTELQDSVIRQNEIKKSYDTLLLSLASMEDTKTQLLDHLNQFKEEFEQNGGIIKAEREKLLSDIHQLENERKKISDEIKAYTSTLLPLHISFRLLGEARKQIRDEESIHFVNKLDNLLGNQELENIMQQLQLSSNKENKERLKKSLLDSIKRDGAKQIIHDASFSDSSMIEQAYLKTIDLAPASIKERVDVSNQKLQLLKVLKERLKINDTTSEFDEILRNMEHLQKELAQNDEKIAHVKTELVHTRTELEQINVSIDKLEHAIYTDKKTKTSFKEARKIMQMSERFRKLQLQKKLQQVQQEALTMLNKLLRKKDYIHTLQINPDTYEVDLLDAQDRPINKLTLSSGEKQMLLIALIWAVFKSSHREVPFIFDTLLGRLDKSHKNALLRDFIPFAGTQSIILSTDSEIDEEYYKVLQPYLAKEYTLNFKVSEQATTILHEYLSLLTEGAINS